MVCRVPNLRPPVILFLGAWALVNGFFLVVGASAGWSERDDRWIVFLESGLNSAE